MSLSAELVLTRGALRLEADFALGRGETVALVGPNGAGKSTLLDALAGLLPIERGRIAFDAELWDGGPDGAFVPPEARRVGCVFQEPRLFPHLCVLENVAFGPRSRGTPARAARRSAAEWLARVGLAARAEARPAALSGGEAQRVALARALASEPRVLLLDEPLSAVDASAKVGLRRELRAHLAAFDGPRLVVVHDLADALALAERLLVLEDGRLVQGGSPAELVARPRSRYVADLVGLNVFHGTAHEDMIELDGGRLIVAQAHAGPVIATVHPRAVAVFRERPTGSPRNVWRAPVAALEPTLERVRVRFGGALPIVAELTPAAVAELALREGAEAWVAIKATEIAVAPA